MLTAALFGLRDAGNSILIIEHNLELVACADWVIDMGPEGGERGGEVVVAGPPETVAGHARSHTGKHLATVLERHRPLARGPAPATPTKKAARSPRR
jgi:excinuclease ABC subunit A